MTCLAAATDWPTFGRDPQRSGWAFDESILTVANVSGLELKWKTQVKNQPHALSPLTAPAVASGVATPSGIKTLVYVAGTSNNISALDAETGEVIWNLVFEIHISPKDPDIFQCYNGITATPTIDRKRNVIYVIAAGAEIPRRYRICDECLAKRRAARSAASKTTAVLTTQVGTQ